MFKTTYSIPIFVSHPRTVILTSPESFTINGTQYIVKPDVTGKVRGGKDGGFFFNQSKGFAGRKFVIITDDHRRIVTRNLWKGDEADGPDNARFYGDIPKTVKMSGFKNKWEKR